MMTLEQAREFFQEDRFAMNMGIEIVEVREGYARCRLPVTPALRNAGGAVQGGAIFTLADFAFAVAANLPGNLTVSVNNSISFLKPGKGAMLFGEAKAISVAKRMCFYEVNITDDLGTLVAVMSVTGYTRVK